MSAALNYFTEETRVTDFTFQKYAKFKPQSVILQNRFTGTTPQEQKNTNSLMNLEKGAAGQYNGFMSPGTRRKVRGIIENYLTAVQLSTSMTFPKSFPSKEVYPTFLTLTLPVKQLHCDNDIKEQFARFMEYMTGSRERGNSGWNVKNYIWVAETQKNGNIHFHVILDRAILAASVQKEWNRILERLGYITRFRNRQQYIYSNGFYVRKDMMTGAIERAKLKARKASQKFDLKAVRQKEKERQKLAYEKGVSANWSNPPTADIHKIESIKKLTAYVSKYMTKEPEFKKPNLGPGETLIDENGKYFIKTEFVEQTESIEGIQIETVHSDLRPINVVFLNRRLRGRIWGSSNALHTENLNPYTVALESTHFVTSTTITHKPIIIKEAVYTINIFGERVFSHMEPVEHITKLSDSKRDFDATIVDDDAKKWVQWLKEEHVPQADIDRATARAGEHFTHYGGEIIPLEFTQKDLLKAYSPVMYGRYEQYYQGIFNTLYPAEYAS
jgi:hypothetical protein